MALITDPWFYAAAVPAVLLAGISKGGLGGSVGFVSVPLIALTVSPVQAAALMLPILCVMDIQSCWIYRRSVDRAVLATIVPASILGILAGTLTFRYLDDNAIRLIIGMIAVSFVLNQLWRHRLTAGRAEPSVAKGGLWAGVSGFTSFVAHAGSPPLHVYLLPLGLDKTMFVGTSAIFFAVVNYVKLAPYAWLGQFDAQNLWTSAILLPLAPVGVGIGAWLHTRMDNKVFYRIAYAALSILGVKLILDGVGL